MSRSTTPSNIPNLRETKAATRYRLWIDSIGGFLLCLGDQVVLGSAADASADIPLHGDLSRQHARIRRTGEMYLLDPSRSVRLGGRPVERATTLGTDQEIELGQGVRLGVARPHPLSDTVRLDFLGVPRCSLSVDAVLIMADTCILGPDMRNHIYCPAWQGNVVLFRQGDSLGCSFPGPLTIDGQACEGRGVLQSNSRVEGPDFAFSLETC
jgi:hypothetical protein